MYEKERLESDILRTVTYVDVSLAGTGFDEDTLTMSSGKEFSLIKTVGGKVSTTQCVCG